MSEDDGYSRRRVLGAATSVDVLGAATGAATGARLSDLEAFTDNPMTTGSFGLELAVSRSDGRDPPELDEDDFESAATIPLDLSELHAGDAGVVRIGSRLCENPGWVWLRARIDDRGGDGEKGEGSEDDGEKGEGSEDDGEKGESGGDGGGVETLGEHLHLKIIDRPACGETGASTPGSVRFDGTVAEADDGEIDDGVLLGDDCLGCTPSCLDVEWRFDPSDADDPAALSRASMSLRLEFVAVQCRHTEDPRNPWN